MKIDVIGAGLAGLVTTAELTDAGKRVLLLDQEPQASLGGASVVVIWGLVFSRLSRTTETRYS